ncbi:hypothetical protein WMF18_36100 [Sorangium sp. So ce315]|uniref:hypothetical protein n=1 Tax=Sorangium sp. So ce315 TaxID=3133299 RepID=UPI003F619AC8
MPRTSLALAVVLSLPVTACANHPDIAGKAIVTLDGQSLVLDTGNDGQAFATTGERWATDCYIHQSALAMMLDRARDDDPPINGITLLVKHADEQGRPLPNVWLDMYPDAYNGFCDVTATLGDDPHEVDFSAAGCELQRGLDGRSAWLVSATFHVKECENE